MENDIEKLRRLAEASNAADREYRAFAWAIVDKIDKSKETQDEPQGLSSLACPPSESCK